MTRPTAASCAAPRRSTCRCRLRPRRPLLKLGIVSDLHCNIDGLDRALEAMGPIEALLCLGDSIFEYRFSNAVIGRLGEIDALTILGNHEEVFLGAAGMRARFGAEIDQPLLDWLAERPHRRELRIDGKRILMVHSTPWEPRGSYVLPTNSELQRFGEAGADIVLYSHTPAGRPSHRSGAGGQSRLGPCWPRPAQWRSVELRHAGHGDGGGRGARFPGAARRSTARAWIKPQLKDLTTS